MDQDTVANDCINDAGHTEVLLTLADVTFDAKPGDWQGFDDFLNACPVWTMDDAFVFHLANQLLLPQRHQGSNGLCSMHAAVVLQHYLVALHQPDVGMIDMMKMIQQCFPSCYIEDRIFRSVSGGSVAMLEEIFEPGSALHVTDTSHYEKYLKKCGPGLVCNFSIHEDFHGAYGTFSFDGTPHGAYLGEHTMVLIGARQDVATGKRWFLLQNWWKDMQFVEVSEDYLESCGSRTFFVTTPQPTIPAKFLTQNHLVAQ